MPPSGNPHTTMRRPEPRRQGHARPSKEYPPQRRKHASRSCPAHPKKKAAALRPSPLLSSRHVDVVVLQRERTDALAGRRRIGVEYGGGGRPEEEPLPGAPPSAAAQHDARLLPHFA